MKLIDKDALLKVIIKRRDAALTRQHNLESIGQESVLNEMVAFELNRIISLIDTHEVKEVDLEEELNAWRSNHFHGRRDWAAAGEYLERSSQLDIAKYFFELGMSVNNKARKGE